MDKNNVVKTENDIMLTVKIELIRQTKRAYIFFDDLDNTAKEPFFGISKKQSSYDHKHRALTLSRGVAKREALI
jgi:hypothetical protein